MLKTYISPLFVALLILIPTDNAHARFLRRLFGIGGGGRCGGPRCGGPVAMPIFRGGVPQGIGFNSGLQPGGINGVFLDGGFNQGGLNSVGFNDGGFNGGFNGGGLIGAPTLGANDVGGLGAFDPSGGIGGGFGQQQFPIGMGLGGGGQFGQPQFPIGSGVGIGGQFGGASGIVGFNDGSQLPSFLNNPNDRSNFLPVRISGDANSPLGMSFSLINGGNTFTPLVGGFDAQGGFGLFRQVGFNGQTFNIPVSPRQLLQVREQLRLFMNNPNALGGQGSQVRQNVAQVLGALDGSPQLGGFPQPPGSAIPAPQPPPGVVGGTGHNGGGSDRVGDTGGGGREIATPPPATKFAKWDAAFGNAKPVTVEKLNAFIEKFRDSEKGDPMALLTQACVTRAEPNKDQQRVIAFKSRDGREPQIFISEEGKKADEIRDVAAGSARTLAAKNNSLGVEIQLSGSSEMTKPFWLDYEMRVDPPVAPETKPQYWLKATVREGQQTVREVYCKVNKPEAANAVNCDLIPGEGVGTLGGSGQINGWYLNRQTNQCDSTRDYGSAGARGPFSTKVECEEKVAAGLCKNATVGATATPPVGPSPQTPPNVQKFAAASPLAVEMLAKCTRCHGPGKSQASRMTIDLAAKTLTFGPGTATPAERLKRNVPSMLAEHHAAAPADQRNALQAWVNGLQ